MTDGGRIGQRWTRRAVLSGLAGMCLPAKAGVESHFPAEASGYADAATEFPVVRLTSPSTSSSLPSAGGRAAMRTRDWLLYCSDRAGRPQVFRMDLKSGESDQLTDAEALDGASICLLADERRFCYFDGMSLRQKILANLRDREIYRVPNGWLHGTGLSVSGDGLYAAFPEVRGKVSRLRLLAIAKGNANTLIEGEAVLSDPALQPKRAAIIYHREGGGLWGVNYDGRDNRRLKLAPGEVGPAYWTAEGRSILYLHYPEDRSALNAIREHDPELGTDQLVAATSQFACFSPNADASMFVGASANKGSPHVLILDRTTRRELTLCEHRASDPRAVAPQFSPNSQRVYFQSDQHGKPAIYCMRVDKLVTKTET